MQPRLLVLDDDETIHEVLSVFFENKGWEVVAVSAMRDAIEAAGRRQFDVAILDINLAGENGIELLRFFKTNFPELPVIIYTGMPGVEEWIEKAMLRGASGFMRKTDSLENLFEAVKSYIRAP